MHVRHFQNVKQIAIDAIGIFNICTGIIGSEFTVNEGSRTTRWLNEWVLDLQTCFRHSNTNKLTKNPNFDVIEADNSRGSSY